jgi:phosphoglycolate phosphatase-like HAD superfamily hydrolase
LQCDVDRLIANYTDPVNNDLGWGIPPEEQPAMYNRQEKFHAEQIRLGNFVPEIYPGLEKIIPELSEEYDLSLITVNTRMITNALLEKHDLIKYFPVRRTLCCTKERNYKAKPFPDALYCLINETNHDLDKTIMIGDSFHDIEMAHAAGVKSIAVLWGTYVPEKAIAAMPTMALRNTHELPAAVEKLLNA